MTAVIVDSHVHIVAADEARYPMKAGPKSAWLRSMPAEQLLAGVAAAGIDRTILVQPFGAYGFDNAYTTDSAAAWPERFAGVCSVDPLLPDAAEVLTHWVTRRGAAGLRLHGPAAGVPLDDPLLHALVRRAGELGIPVCVLTEYAGIGGLAGLLRQFPDIPFALDHMGFPPLEEGPADGSAAALFDLAGFSNLFLKFSSLNLLAASRGGSAGDAMRHIVDWFGPERLVWGSNFPATADMNLREQLDYARAALTFLAETDRNLMLGETAARLWPGGGSQAATTAPGTA